MNVPLAQEGLLAGPGHRNRPYQKNGLQQRRKEAGCEARFFDVYIFPDFLCIEELIDSCKQSLPKRGKRAL